MAAIAKFISYDGGIAFSDSVVKIQKREGEGRTFPLDQVDSVGVRRSQQDPDGFIRIQLTDGKKYRLFFAEEQLKEALQFKKQLEAVLASLPAEEPPAPKEPPVRKERSRREKQTIKYDDAGMDEFVHQPEPRRTSGGMIALVIVLAVLAVVCIALGVVLFLRGRPASADAGLPAAVTALARCVRL